MNILLCELNSFENIENKPFHYGNSALSIAINLVNQTMQTNQSTSETSDNTYLLAKKGSLLANIAKNKGIQVLYLPEGNFAQLRLVHMLRKHKLNAIHTFDIDSANLIIKVKSFLQKNILLIHSENRLTEEKEVFASKSFEKIDSYVFADALFQRYYKPGMMNKKSSELPIVSLQHIEKTIENEEEPQITQILANSYTIDQKSKNAKARFLVPLPYIKDSQYKEILEFLKNFDSTTDFEWEAHFYGLGDEMQNFLDYATELGIEHNLLAFFADENEDSYQFCDLCILTLPREEYIVSPLLLAWKNKIPALSTTSIPYFRPAKHNENIYVADINKKDLFLKSMIDLLENDELRTKLILEGNARYNTILNLCDAYPNFYREEIKNKNT